VMLTLSINYYELVLSIGLSFFFTASYFLSKKPFPIWKIFVSGIGCLCLGLLGSLIRGKGILEVILLQDTYEFGRLYFVGFSIIISSIVIGIMNLLIIRRES